MYTEHEQGGGGDGGKPEQMDMEVGIVIIPIARFKGGCEQCQLGAKGVMNTLLIEAMGQAISTLKLLLEKGRGECTVEVATEQQLEHMLREKIGNDMTDKILELTKHG